VFDLVALDGAMLRNDFLEELAKRRNVPLPVIEVVEQLALVSCGFTPNVW
jgi:hypothetical protein